jgi:hypothetical protein
VTGTAHSCTCGTTTGLRPYPCGWRCAHHTPAALATAHASIATATEARETR